MAGQFTLTSTRRAVLLGSLPLAGCAAGAVPLGTQKSALSKNAAIEAESGDLVWRRVRTEFSHALSVAHMNAANMAPPCAAAKMAQAEASASIDADPSFENRAKYEARHEETRQAIAALIGAEADEIALTRNTSEGNNLIVQGLPLGPGDEVVLWSENHRSNNLSWEVRAARDGFKVIKVDTPEQPETVADLLAPFERAITPKTKVVAFSHVSNASGTALPARALCAMAKDVGAVSLVDGAQTVGALNIDVNEIGCDFLTTSGQKWLTGPREAGFAYVRRDLQEKLSPLIVSYPLADGIEGARKFEQLGQRDDGAVDALGAAVAFHNAVGPARAEARVRALSTMLMEEIKRLSPGAEFVTPLVPDLRFGVVITKLTQGTPAEAQADAYKTYKVAGSARPVGLRLCPHIYHHEAEIERAAVAIAAWA